MTNPLRTPWLPNKPPLLLDPELACIFGVTEALIIQLVHSGTADSAENVQHLHDEMQWARIPLAEWRKKLPFLADRTIRHALDNLKDQTPPILLTGCYDKDPRERTLYYRIDCEALAKTCSESSMTERGTGL